MIKVKKPYIMRHPYLTLMVFGLAAIGAISITNGLRSFVQEKGRCIEGMIKKHDDEE